MLLKYKGKSTDSVIPFKVTRLDRDNKEVDCKIVRVVPGKEFELNDDHAYNLLRKAPDCFEQVKAKPQAQESKKK